MPPCCGRRGVLDAGLRRAHGERARVVGRAQVVDGARRVAQLGERALVDDAACAHDRNAVAQLLDLGEQVAGQHHGHPFAGQAPHELAHVAHAGGIEAGRRLVEEHEPGRAQERSCDPQALAHPVRIAADAVLRAIAQLDDVEDLVDAARGAVAVQRRAQVEVAPAGQVRVEARRLDEARDPVERGHARLRVAPEQAHAALGRSDEPEHHAQRRGLPRAVGPEIAEDVAGEHREVDAVDRHELPVALDQTADLDRSDVGHGQRPRAAASAAVGGTDPATV